VNGACGQLALSSAAAKSVSVTAATTRPRLLVADIEDLYAAPH
jgi:hypothetical protein